MQLTKYVHESHMNKQRSRSFIELGLRSLNFTFSNLSLETAKPIEAEFHMEPSGDRGMIVCSNGLDHMTKMPAMPIYDKILKKKKKKKNLHL